MRLAWARARPTPRAWIAAAFAAAAALTSGVSSAPGRETDTCGLPDAGTVWVDYGEGPVKPDTRAVFARPGVVVATSGAAMPKYFRGPRAATAYFVLHLPNIVGQPAKPADPATIPAAADALFAKAVASTACATPWIALNELFGSALATPGRPTNTQYRANVLALMQGLAAHGARPVLFVSGNPNVAGDAAGWWQQVAQTGAIVYEAYYDAKRAAALGSLLGSRRMRLGIRSTVALFQSIGITPDRLGIALGFHSGGGQGAGGRQGLQPREAWLRVVKWEALAAKQVAADTKLGSVWSWGWGTFGPASVDPDKPAAACVYLWARGLVALRRPGRRRTGLPCVARRRADRLARADPLRALRGKADPGSRRDPTHSADARPPRGDRRALRAARPPLDGNGHERPGARCRETGDRTRRSAAAGPRT